MISYTKLIADARKLAAAGSTGPFRVIREDEDCGTFTYAILPQNEGATVAWVPEDCNDKAKADSEFIAWCMTHALEMANALELLHSALESIAERTEYDEDKDWDTDDLLNAFNRANELAKNALGTNEPFGPCNDEGAKDL